MKHKILIVGSNPSIKSPDQSAFHPSTRSRMVLDGWFKDFEIEDMAFINISNEKKENNKPLSKSEIINELPVLTERLSRYQGYKIVGVGNVAKIALTLLQVNFHGMPHPSGRCRVWNSKALSELIIASLHDYIRK